VNDRGDQCTDTAIVRFGIEWLYPW